MTCVIIPVPVSFRHFSHQLASLTYEMSSSIWFLYSWKRLHNWYCVVYFQFLYNQRCNNFWLFTHGPLCWNFLDWISSWCCPTTNSQLSCVIQISWSTRLVRLEYLSIFMTGVIRTGGTFPIDVRPVDHKLTQHLKDGDGYGYIRNLFLRFRISMTDSSARVLTVY